MKNLAFKFYSVLKNEDAMPFIGSNLLVVADGLGGSGSTVHAIDKAQHPNMRGEILASAFGDMTNVSPSLTQYIEDLIVPMSDGLDDTSALWASRIVIARCVYALTEGELKDANLNDEKVRAKLAEFIIDGLTNVAQQFNLQNGKYDGQLLLPTTLAFIRYTETKHSVIAETVWAGDSRCYALTPDGLKLLSIDDEDNSGSITNLFYADNKKCVLHYLRHEIAKPCVLLTVSDGVFDPFDPHDNLGVEHTLLSNIKECKSLEEFGTALKIFYDGIHGDDVTIAFNAFGFHDYADMQKKLAKRTDKILSIRKQQAQMYSALEVMHQSEEDASHYVLARTGDRYDYIIPVLVDLLEKGTDDVAITTTVRNIFEGIKKDTAASAERTRKQNREQALAGLYTYVKEHPELVVPQILTNATLDFRGNYSLQYAFEDLKKYSVDYATVIKNSNIQALEAQLETRREDLHRRIMEKITFCRNEFDRLWYDKNTDYKLRSGIKDILRIWQEIDFDLQYNWKVSNIGSLPECDRALAREVDAYVDEYRNSRWQINAIRERTEISSRAFLRAWDSVFNCVKNNVAIIPVLFSQEIVHMFGFDVAEEIVVGDIGKGNRERMLSELKAHKTIIVSEIVRALSVNCDKTSAIDGQFNATKLELFRTYYRLKENPTNDVSEFEAELATLEKAYTSLID